MQRSVAEPRSFKHEGPNARPQSKNSCIATWSPFLAAALSHRRRKLLTNLIYAEGSEVRPSASMEDGALLVRSIEIFVERALLEIEVMHGAIGIGMGTADFLSVVET